MITANQLHEIINTATREAYDRGYNDGVRAERERSTGVNVLQGITRHAMEKVDKLVKEASNVRDT